MRRKLFGRRKRDKVILALAGVGVLSLLAYMGACDKTSPTKPDPVEPATVSSTTPASSGTATTPTVEATPTPKPERPVSAICQGNPIMCHFETDKLRPVSARCTPPGIEWSPANDWGSWSGTTDDTVSPLDICTKVPGAPLDCAPVDKTVQIDFHAAGRHAGHLGPAWKMHFPQKLSAEECEECEPEWTPDEPVYGECLPVVGAQTTEVTEQCERTKTTTYRNQCDEKTREKVETEPCECPCIEPEEHETTPQLPVWDETILRGQCDPEVLPLPVPVNALNGEEKNCHIVGTQDVIVDWICEEDRTRTLNLCKNVECPCVPEWSEWVVIDTNVDEGQCEPILPDQDIPECQQTIITTITEERTERCSQETEQRQRIETETVPCECEGGGEGCHLSNQGAPGDSNFNVTAHPNIPAHGNHTSPPFCPGDIPADFPCTCEQALAQARACGDPAGFGWGCKVVGPN